MKCKERILFVSIVLTVLLGYIAQDKFIASTAGETSFGSSVETPYRYDKAWEQEENLSTEYILPDQKDAGYALRHCGQTKRTYHSYSSKCGLAFIKRNQIQFISQLIPESFKRCFPEPIEARRYLISLRKLII